MNFRGIALGLFLICTICTLRVISFECTNGSWTNGILYSTRNKIFENVKISREEDPDQRTQLSIRVFPKKDFTGSSCKVILSSSERECHHYSEQIFKVEEPVVIPGLAESEEYLKPGCNYSLIYVIEDHCIQTYYEVPEKRPCEHSSSEDTFDSFPNEVLDNVSINAFKKNAVRLNISLSARPEYSNINGTIVINSKMASCDHTEEFSFGLSESSLVVPRAEFPHSFIQTGCEYMIDFELNNGYCVTTTYKVPDLCLGFHPRAEVTDVVREQQGVYRVVWDSKTTERNETVPIINIDYRLEDVSYEEFSSQMVVENNFNLNYSLLNFSRLKKPRIYRLIATFLNEKECSHTSSFDFEVRGDPGVFLFILASAILLFGLVPAICMCIPTMRKKILAVSKRFFDKTIVQVHVPTSEPLYFDIRRKEEINLSYVPIELQNCDEFEFPINFRKLEFDLDINPKCGNFGEVRKAKAYGINKLEGFTTVAVKKLKDGASEEDEQALKEEISTLKKIAYHGNHENVVKMLACCSISKPYMILLEFVPCGDLKSYLIVLRNEWSIRKNNRHFVFPVDKSSCSYISPNSRTISETSSNLPSPTETELTALYDESDETSPTRTTSIEITPVLSNIDLQNFALQIARGMAFLESISVVHRDLAARNVLISEDKILKISDFGMSRNGDYVNKNTNKQQPVRWMAPESIEKFTCTSRSDVWSFGVVLWEIGTLGAFPYDSISNDCILEYLLYSLKKGIRLMRPEISTDELYSLMLKCWSMDPQNRPSFQEIVDFLSGEKKKIYLDLRKLNPAYVFPPTKQI
ncbi:mast/stem cell growth factor receptor Kit-like [Coccinella septempunctata]|uniref:mast/stem cell growth factor receptor Kit-like n=1 Tax=Coccinella septempunctata TaxID=41139 RepID=UPI001D0907A9|nr:mast/stem cell growth factor receptor Kit-like [Coccinella septempunctata]